MIPHIIPLCPYDLSFGCEASEKELRMTLLTPLHIGYRIHGRSCRSSLTISLASTKWCTRSDPSFFVSKTLRRQLEEVQNFQGTEVYLRAMYMPSTLLALLCFEVLSFL